MMASSVPALTATELGTEARRQADTRATTRMAAASAMAKCWSVLPTSEVGAFSPRSPAARGTTIRASSAHELIRAEPAPENGARAESTGEPYARYAGTATAAPTAPNPASAAARCRPSDRREPMTPPRAGVERRLST